MYDTIYYYFCCHLYLTLSYIVNRIGIIIINAKHVQHPFYSWTLFPTKFLQLSCSEIQPFDNHWHNPYLSNMLSFYATRCILLWYLTNTVWQNIWEKINKHSDVNLNDRDKNMLQFRIICQIFSWVILLSSSSLVCLTFSNKSCSH